VAQIARAGETAQVMLQSVAFGGLRARRISSSATILWSAGRGGGWQPRRRSGRVAPRARCV